MFDSRVWDSLPQGSHLIVVDGAWQAQRRNVRPDQARVLAVAKLLEKKLCDHISDALHFKPKKKMSEEQIEAWNSVRDVLGETTLSTESVADAVQGAVESLEAECEEVLEDPAIKKAWEQLDLLISLKSNCVK